MSDGRYWLGFNKVKGIGPVRLQRLIDHFGSLEAAWAAPAASLRAAGLDRRTVGAIEQTRPDIDLAAEMSRLSDLDVRLLTWDDPGYPAYLREVPHAPPVLFMQGEVTTADRWAVAIVGTRKLTRYGRQVTRDLVAGLVRFGVTIVSGLARGIDAVAHQTALELGGRTIAVLGSGLDAIYPPEHRTLASRIASERGALLSEYALGVKAEARNFPPRNRIISGLSRGIVVIEAGERSGALITAHFALEQDREVLAVPGNINSPASAGCNRLIQQGAKLVQTAEDVVEELSLMQAPQQAAIQMAIPETAEEAALLPHLTGRPQHIDELIRAAGLPSALVSSTLTLLELRGVVQQVGGMNYALSGVAGVKRQ